MSDASTTPTKNTSYYPALHGGKYHARRNPIQVVALCRGTLELDTTAGPIVRGPLSNGRPHPMLCKRCLTATETASETATETATPSASA